MADFTILEGHVLNAVDEIDEQSVNMVVTSPPYWGLRDYGEETVTIWGGDPDCEHIWGSIQGKIRRKESPGVGAKQEMDVTNGNFCQKCNAWRGQLGLEPTPQLFVQHLVQIFNAIKPKLRDDGTLWVNLGDTYWGGGNGQGHTTETTNAGEKTLERGAVTKPVARGSSHIKRKSMIGIPERFMIAMVDSGWVLRNKIIWHKPAPMPSSAKDRFTNDFEYLYFFSKNPQYYFKQQFEPLSDSTRTNFTSGSPKISQNSDRNDGDLGERSKNMTFDKRNKRTTWSINTAKFPDAHFAVFPRKLVETPIRAGCPEKGVVLDPFMGSGTTGIETLSQHKDFIGIEINPDYAEMARKRLTFAKNSSDISELF